MRDANGSLDVRFSTPYNQDDPMTEVHIEDRGSGQVIAIFAVTQAQLTNLIRGAVLTDVPAWLVPDNLRHRIGKRMEVEKLRIPREVAGYSHDDAARDAAQAWADDRAAALGYEEARVGLHNYGWSAVLRRWVPEPAS